MTEENDTIFQLQVEEGVEASVGNATEDLNADAPRNEVIITLEGRDITMSMEALEVTMESEPRSILEAVSGIIEEETGSARDGYQDAYNDYTYAVRKAFNTNTIYVYPKPVAG